jgi:hypothetical protein
MISDANADHNEEEHSATLINFCINFGRCRWTICSHACRSTRARTLHERPGEAWLVPT